jgi:putative methyltransferase (TIGR04325 family)
MVLLKDKADDFSKYDRKFIKSFPITKDPKPPKQLIKEFLEIIKSLNKTSLTIVDFGGADGKYHRIIKAELPQIICDYHIVETPQSVSEFSAKYKWLAKYYTDIKEIKLKPDLVFFGSSLQYAEKPYEILDYTINILEPSKILIQRIYVSDDKDYAYIQDHDSWKVACWVFSRSSILDIIYTKYFFEWEHFSENEEILQNVIIKNYLFSKKEIK